MNILILAAGETRMPSASNPYPTWLSEIDGKVLLEHQIRALLSNDEDLVILAFRQADIRSWHVDDIARQIFPKAEILSIKGNTAGAACTALLTIGKIDLQRELIVASATDHIDIDVSETLATFRSAGADAGVVTFDSLHPRYAFFKKDADGFITEAAEKRPISRSASAGFYWYRKALDFFESIQRMVLKDAHVDGVFYISPSLNELVLAGKRIASVNISPDAYHPLKDQRQFESLEHHMEGKRRHAD